MNRAGILLLCSLFLVNRFFAQDLITITEPNGGEAFRGGSVISVNWNSSGSVPNVNIDYNDGSVWIPVSDAQDLPNTGSYKWQIPDISIAEVKIRVTKSSDISISDESNSSFRIISPNIFSNPVVIMPLGNSITFDTHKDETRPDGERISYRFDLWDALRGDDISFDFVGSQSSGYDIFPDHQNEGHSGWRDDQIALNIYGWLQANPNTDIILLHIGTNALDSSRADVQNILNQIDAFESNFAKQIWVVLARIINRVPYSSLTTTFNNNIQDMVNARINNGDKLLMVDMEDGAGLNYSISTTPPYSGGDMYDDLHPNPNGYSKMANVWYNALKLLLPAPTPSAPVITSSALVNAVVGQPYTYDVNATGVGAPDYLLTVNPSGMDINSSTGKISWTPGSSGNYNVSVEARNSSGSDFQNFTIVVSDAPDCSPAMISYWKLDESSGTSYSDQIGTNNAVAGTTAPIPASGQVAGAQQFNGFHQINVPADPSFDFAANSSFSVEFWYKGSAVPTTVKSAVGRYIGTTGARWWVGLNANDGRARFYMSAGGSSAAVLGPIITDGNWHHVTATRNGSTGSLRIYVDGVLRSSTTKFFSSGFESPSADLNIGWLSQQSVYAIAGTLDEVAIHNAELFSTDIQTHYNSGLAGLGYCGQSGIFKINSNKEYFFSNFIGYAENNRVRLSWQTSIETDRFEIQRSETNFNENWITLSTIKTKDKHYSEIFYDDSVNQKNKYLYRVKLFAPSGGYAYSDAIQLSILPNDYILYQNYPNPFNPVTTINFTIPKAHRVTIKVFNQLGEEVTTLLDEEYEAGFYETQLDAKQFASGVYYYRIHAGDYTDTKKLVLIK